MLKGQCHTTLFPKISRIKVQEVGWGVGGCFLVFMGLRPKILEFMGIRIWGVEPVGLAWEDGNKDLGAWNR